MAVALSAAALFLLLSALSQAAEAPLISDPAYTHAQTLVDVGHGRRLNLYCQGSGSPTVVFDSGLGDSMLPWGLVQPAVARSTRACAYDRAGLGFSDASDHPDDASHNADDLYALLQAAHIAPPYVLVGHSAAGMYVRVFADRHPQAVVGMVVVEGSHEDQSSRSWALDEPGRQQKWDEWLQKMHGCIDKAKQGALTPGSEDFSTCTAVADPRFSPDIRAAIAAYEVTPKWQEAVASEREAVFYASAEQTRATRKDFGDIPLIMLTHSPFPKADDESQELRNSRTLLWEELHLQVAAMSSRGVNEIVPGSEHYIQLDHPQVVVDAIRQAVDIARAQPEVNAASGRKVGVR